MLETIRKLAAVVRWVIASEELPPADLAAQQLETSRTRFFQWVVKGDKLDVDQDGVPAESVRAGFLTRVLAADELPEGPVASASVHTGGLIRWLLSGEALPDPLPETEIEAPRQSLLHWMTALEVCPTHPQPATQVEQSLIRRILAAETCPSHPPPPREVASGFIPWILSPEICPEEPSETPHRRRGFFGWLLSREEL